MAWNKTTAQHSGRDGALIKHGSGSNGAYVDEITLTSKRVCMNYHHSAGRLSLRYIKSP